MSDTKIEWTDKVWNPTRGCSRVSAGCLNCYAMRQARRHDHPGGSYEGLTRIGKRGVDWSGVVRLVPEQLDAPLRWKKPQRIFVDSMSDLFHESLAFEQILDVYHVMVTARQHTFQVLTKRPERRLEFYRWLTAQQNAVGEPGPAQPPRNVWEIVSVEDQKTADERIPLLLQTPAAVRGVSYEPALGPVNFKYISFGGGYNVNVLFRGRPFGDRERLDWIVVGGESGPGARPFNLAWARAVVAQGRSAGVPVFVKQLGARPLGCLADRDDDDYEPDHCDSYEAGESRPCPPGKCIVHSLKDHKGGDMSEWPSDLRVREFPS